MINSGIGGYEPLAMEFMKSGFTMSCLERQGDVAIYEQRGALPSEVWWEVVVVKRMEAATVRIGGVEVKYSAREVYPGTSQWGQMAWTYHTLEQAREKFKKILQRLSENK